MSGQEVIEQFNQVVQSVYPGLLEKLGWASRMPRYRYWQFEKELFCWNTEPTHDGKFSAFIYRYVKSKRVWKLVRKVDFGRRKVAKARAYKWYQQAMEEWKEKVG